MSRNNKAARFSGHPVLRNARAIKTMQQEVDGPWSVPPEFDQTFANNHVDKIPESQLLARLSKGLSPG
jgi:hypothetical protein